MIYEVREYEAAVGRMPALIDRFNEHTFALLAKHGMDVVQIGLTTVGERAFHEIVYTLRFADMAEMDRKWASFLADPAWLTVAEQTEANGPLVQNIRRRLLNAAPFIEPSTEQN